MFAVSSLCGLHVVEFGRLAAAHVWLFQPKSGQCEHAERMQQLTLGVLQCACKRVLAVGVWPDQVNTLVMDFPTARGRPQQTCRCRQ